MSFYNGGSANGGVDSEYFNKFSEADEMFLPVRGEGESKATQICTAVTKLVYKWYNDGDVFDNVHSGMEGWWNNLSDYANWLYTYVPEARPALCLIYNCETHAQYEHLLAELADAVNTMEFLKTCENEPLIGSIYDCDGPFKYSDGSEYEDDEDEDEDEWEDE